MMFGMCALFTFLLCTELRHCNVLRSSWPPSQYRNSFSHQYISATLERRTVRPNCRPNSSRREAQLAAAKASNIINTPSIQYPCDCVCILLIYMYIRTWSIESSPKGVPLRSLVEAMAKPRVLVIGSQFSGTFCARELKSQCLVTVVDAKETLGQNMGVSQKARALL